MTLACIIAYLCIIRTSCRPLPSSVPPATPARRRSTGCSRHPELELVALGSDSLAGQPAVGARLAPERLAAGVRPERRGARERRRRRLPLPRQRRAPPRSSRPAGAVVVDLSGAHRLARRRALCRVVRVRASDAGALADWSYALPELYPADGPADREPGLLRDRGAARARAAARRDRAGERRRRRQVGRVGRRAAS